MNVLGIFHSYSDPSAALVKDGRVIAFAEEERFLRNKHAVGCFPVRAIRYVLETAALDISDVDYVCQAWDCPAYDDGTVAAKYSDINAQYPTMDADIAYQRSHLQKLCSSSQSDLILRNLRQEFGDVKLPPVRFVQHHLAHATMAYVDSAMNNALVLTIDGSGEWTTNAWWRGSAGKLELLAEVSIPHSLGWFYSAFTEYLGFRAYDGEYKVMGLAAYGKPDKELANSLSEIIWYDGNGGFETDPMLLSRGTRSYSYYYPDALVQKFGRPPRGRTEEISEWHMSLAFEVQRRLEEVVEDMVRYWTKRTGLRKIAIAGGVGLNIKMNGRLFGSGLVEDIFIHPLCADSGISIGAGMVIDEAERLTLAGTRIGSVSWGPQYSPTDISRILDACKQTYSTPESIVDEVAELLDKGQVVGWFQGQMEGGPRALGNRSILADPRKVESRDRVNSVIKFREFWRPFCPSMTPEGAERYLAKYTHAPFMIVAFEGTKTAADEIPAVVHVDNTLRVQIVEEKDNQIYFELLKSFERRTGVPCLLNTSFNIKGEPIVCTPHDAIRTFSATGLDALAIGPFLLRK